MYVVPTGRCPCLQYIIARDGINDNDFELIGPYLPDLTPLDLHLFPKLNRKQFKYPLLVRGRRDTYSGRLSDLSRKGSL